MGNLYVLVENIAQAPPCGSIFSVCSENKKLGTGVTTRRHEGISGLLKSLKMLIYPIGFTIFMMGKSEAMVNEAMVEVGITASVTLSACAICSSFCFLLRPRRHNAGHACVRHQ